MQNKTKNYVISLVINGRVNPCIFFGSEEDAKKTAIEIAEKFCFSATENLSVEDLVKRGEGDWFLSGKGYHLELSESPVYGLSDKRFLVDVGECGSVSINGNFVSKLCFDAANVGFSIATWLSEAEAKKE